MRWCRRAMPRPPATTTRVIRWSGGPWDAWWLADNPGRVSDAPQVAQALPGVTSVCNATRPVRMLDAPGRDSY
ncbi:conserved protein of unknown function (plasmid) [Cupriavidus neocaledonicus]|uniref:Uncharacterized protein n=1 Tax=Cupriavidus neocaledonicus TaxID=1040979 RepID=A0A375HPA0_9BURK|nr:hypothetical protein CBM2605_B10026 [Cupriavidus neocaledonicus]SPD58684.1 conserved protein of unknown function [Cupriavidus neocaledonicus]